MKESPAHVIDEIIETLASKLFFHGHPINRKEARNELKLNTVVENPAPDLEAKIWNLYKDFEEDLENRKVFDPLSELFQTIPDPKPSVQNPMGQYPPNIVVPGSFITQDIKMVFVESATLSSCFKQKIRYVVAGTGPGGEPLIRQETLAQQWTDTPAP